MVIRDLAILSCGAVTVPIYESSLPEAAVYILNDSDSKIVFVEDEAIFRKVWDHMSELKSLKQIIVINPPANFKKYEGVYTFDEVMLLGSGAGQSVFDKNQSDLNSESVASYVYTSGTTGHPKGAVLTHGNFLAEMEGLGQILEFEAKSESLLFLPLAHILARVLQFAQLSNGFIQCYAESIDKLLDNISEVKPHIMASVPRIFEKVHGRVLQGVESGSALKRNIFDWALKIGGERAAALKNGNGVSPLLSIKWAIAFKLVFSKLHAKLGGRISYFISGGAPLSKEIGDFFDAAGILILEGYGLTETTAAVTCNTRLSNKVGTVGCRVPGAELKIASDGEILVRGPLVFKGYFKNPEATKEAIDDEGWFHTGDIGVLDEEGFLKITDRKKDIIVTAAGKNIAPQNIENLIKTDPIISQVMVHGDRRKFLSALVTLNKDEIVHYAKKVGLDHKNYAELLQNELLFQYVKSRIDEKNRHLAKYETIKKFAILENDFSVETGELTPTLKVKRKFTSEKYKDIIESFYKE